MPTLLVGALRLVTSADFTMSLGGINYTACPFNGWFMNTEVTVFSSSFRTKTTAGNVARATKLIIGYRDAGNLSFFGRYYCSCAASGAFLEHASLTPSRKVVTSRQRQQPSPLCFATLADLRLTHVWSVFPRLSRRPANCFFPGW